MARTDLNKLVAVAEILASVAVAVSLILLVISMNQNTAALRSNNDNFLYELQSARQSDVNNSPELAAIVVKAWAGDPLDPVEQMRFDAWITRELDMWELAFIRHEEGLLPPSQWDAWDVALSRVVFELPVATWQEWRSGYNKRFQEHVDAAYARRQVKLSAAGSLPRAQP